VDRVLGWVVVIALAQGVAYTAQAQTNVRFIHADALFSVVAISDAIRAVVQWREHEPFGQQIMALEDGSGYAGHVQDASSGLTYMQQRY